MKIIFGVFSFICLVGIILFIIRQDWESLPVAIFGLLFNVGSMLMEDER